MFEGFVSVGPKPYLSKDSHKGATARSKDTMKTRRKVLARKLAVEAEKFCSTKAWGAAPPAWYRFLLWKLKKIPLPSCFWDREVTHKLACPINTQLTIV